MQKRMSLVVAMVAVLFLAGQVLANGPGSQQRGLTRTPGITPGGPQQGAMTQQRTMGKQQMPEQRLNAEQRMEQRGPQATLPEQASETAHAALGSAGLGEETAAAVQATQQARMAEESVAEEPVAELPRPSEPVQQ
jgi:hypothetical protein